MRIISGTLKGKVIIAPGRLSARPTTDFAKTGLFNILTNHFDFEEVSVLDLFCGTGNISYEFGSRGCRHLLAVDENHHVFNFVNETFKKLSLTKARIIRSDAFRFLKTCDDTFDIIFADPPFDSTTTDEIPGIVFEKKMLNKNGWLIVEHQSKRKLEGELQPVETRVYGNCAFSIYKNAD